MSRRIPCTACRGATQAQATNCHECHGLRYIEFSTCTAGKDWKKVCPISSEAMTGGWMCSKCGESGPW